MQNKIILPLAIIVAGGLIAGALFFGGERQSKTSDGEPSFEKMRPVDKDDYVFGNQNAEITLLEYSDPQCPFCRAFHQTMKAVMAELAESGQVAWVYRHFAILGPDSITEAHASECAAEQGGNEIFWNFMDTMFATKNDRARFPAGTSLETVAQEIGLDIEKFRSCQSSRKFEEKILSLRQDAANAGAQGTPYTLVIKNNELVGVIPGALPYENVRQMIEQVLAEAN